LKFSAPLCVLCHSRLIVAQLAALNLPETSRLIAKYRYLFGVGAMPAVFLFAQALFA